MHCRRARASSPRAERPWPSCARRRRRCGASSSTRSTRCAGWWRSGAPRRRRFLPTRAFLRLPTSFAQGRAMDPVLIGQGLLNGLLFGGVYSLMAVGLTLIFGVMRVVNFAHGDMMVWGMYLALLFSMRLGLDPYLSFVLCAAALFVLGFAIQRGLVNRIIDAPHEMQILLM